MQLTVSSGGLKATTKDHGLTEYWAHRLTTCAAPAQFPRLFCWVYRHEGRRLRHELRCHAVLCPTTLIAKQIESELKHSLALALAEFKRDKISKQNARLSLANSVYENPTIPRRKILLSTGSHNYKPPLERSKSAPKLTSIEEILEEEEEVSETKNNVYKRILRHYDSTSALLDKRKTFLRKLHETYQPSGNIVPVHEDVCDESAGKEKEQKVNFSEDIMELTLDDKSDMILEELVQNSLRNDLLESCERAWFNALGEKPDLIPLDSDEGSLSSGCESASTVTSDLDQPVFPTISEEFMEAQDGEKSKPNKKTDLDFKVGGCVLSRVRSFERINSDILKYCGLNYNNNSSKSILGTEEVSLIPVGESQADFSSLKVFKKKSTTEQGKDVCCFESEERDAEGSEGENDSACSDESGYEEEEITSSVANIVLV
ncbi:PID 2 domain containing protein [Asbolus verrucosus]|uniref:PID 2 domain containing protein n=1 Tax=Asbolus verrucosus TaxID=1661398 RepID=A0A482VL32_ASBVE|nr:PID 2 domain containing protein [Asbolus verrucosus]